jgi:hypothetical protein
MLGSSNFASARMTTDAAAAWDDDTDCEALVADGITGSFAIDGPFTSVRTAGCSGGGGDGCGGGGGGDTIPTDGEDGAGNDERCNVPRLSGEAADAAEGGTGECFPSNTEAGVTGPATD